MKLKYKILIIFCVVLLFCSQNCWAWRDYNVILTSFPYEFDDKILAFKLQLENSSNAEAAINIEANILEDLDDIVITYSVGIKENIANNHIVVLNRKWSVCEFLLKQSTHDMVCNVIADILKNKMLIKTCPIKKGPYAMHDYLVDVELLPKYLPEVNFYVGIKLEKTNGVLIFEGHVNGKIDKSKGLDNLRLFSIG